MIRDYLELHFIIFLWGFTAILGGLISIPPTEIVFYRTGISFLALGGLLLIRGISFQIGWTSIIKIFLTGFLISAHWILFFLSARVSTISVCLAGMATLTLWTSILDPLFNHKKLNFVEVFLGIVIIGGLYVIFRFEFDHTLGLVLAIISALTAAIFTIFNGQFTLKHNAYAVNFYEMLGAFISVVLFLPFYGKYLTNTSVQWEASFSDWIYLLILALVCTVYAYGASIHLMRRISVFIINLSVNLEPIYGIVLAVLIFKDKEKMTPGFYWGTLIILSAVFAYPLLKSKSYFRFIKINKKLSNSQ